MDLISFADKEAERLGLDRGIVSRMIAMESGGRANAVSPKGAFGPMQLMPATAQDLAKRHGGDPKNPYDNVRLGLNYLKENLDRFGGDYTKAVAAYQAGPGAVAKHGGPVPYGDGITQNKDYVSRIVGKGGESRLVPVEGNPFEPKQEAKLVPVEGNPFETAKPAAAAPGNAASGGKLSGFLQGARDMIDAGAQAVPRVLANVADRGLFGTRGAILEAQGIKPESVSPVGDVLRGQAASVDTGIQQREQQYQADRTAAGRDGIDWARIGGNVATAAPLVAMAPTGGAQLAGRALASGATGAVLGASQPVTDTENFGSEKAKQAGVGFAGGALAAPVTSFLAGIVKPAVDKGVASLNKAGVTTTVGQTLGGAANRIEQALSSVPFLGDMIKQARYRSIEDFNRAAYSRALEPIGLSMDKSMPVGRAGIAAVESKLSDAYNTLLPKLTGSVDDQLGNELRSLVQGAQSLGPDKARQFSAILQQQIGKRVTPQGNMSGETIKTIESELGRLARGYRSSADFDSRQLGDAVREAQAAIRRMVERQNPNLAPELAKINEGWANYVRLESAAALIGARDGVFSPAQLLSAVKASDRSVRKGAFSRGDALMQDLAETGKRVLGDTVPDSGTASRTLAALGAGGFIEPTTATLGAVGMLPYTRAGQSMANAALTSRPAAASRFAELMRVYGPSSGGAVALPLSNAVQQR